MQEGQIAGNRAARLTDPASHSAWQEQSAVSITQIAHTKNLPEPMVVVKKRQIEGAATNHDGRGVERLLRVKSGMARW
jgi:hypothetical protein